METPQFQRDDNRFGEAVGRMIDNLFLREIDCGSGDVPDSAVSERELMADTTSHYLSGLMEKDKDPKTR